ncbi:hypothetical protein niasHT_004390 [Heterodera trifolii]|uniref:Uncharacterized protein n=1 Tax=Heterodera trifolii TaxID=157864 RepID=A0ABD2LM22_9BILA
MIDELGKKKECKNKQWYCFCEPLHFDQIINGMCCDSTTTCECCKTDVTIKKRPKLVVDLASSSSCKEHQKKIYFIYDFDGKHLSCVWSEGTEANECCGKNYQLVIMDRRYADYKIVRAPHSAIKGMFLHHPFCRNRLPWIHPLVCAFEWYFVPRML